MNKTILAFASAAIIATSDALAGPYRSVTFAGTAQNIDYTLEVPKGKAVAIVNFVDDKTTDQAYLYVSIAGIRAYGIAATPGGDVATSKDVIINGPATITVDAIDGHKILLSYRLFAN